MRGLEHLESLEGPVIFAANHQSHLDTPVILDALPARWRYRVAPAMAKEFFKAHFYPDQFGRQAYLQNSANYYLASLFFNAFPLPQRESRHASDPPIHRRARRLRGIPSSSTPRAGGRRRAKSADSSPARP